MQALSGFVNTIGGVAGCYQRWEAVSYGIGTPMIQGHVQTLYTGTEILLLTVVQSD